MSEQPPQDNNVTGMEPKSREENAPALFGFNRVTGLMNALGTIWIFALMILVNADIFGRDFLNAPIRGTTEITALSIVGIVFLQLAHTLWAGRLTRSDALLNVLMRKYPLIAHGMNALFHFLGAVLMAIIVKASIPYFNKALDIDEYVGAIGDFTAPTWPIRLIILIGGTATTLQFLLLSWNDLTLMKRQLSSGENS